MSEEEKQNESSQAPSERAGRLMEDMLKGLRVFGSAAKVKAEEFGKRATEKAEELTRLGKIKLDIHQLQRSRGKELSELGELVFNLGSEGKLDTLAEHENYQVIRKNIEKLNAEIQEKEHQEAKVASEEGHEVVSGTASEASQETK